MATKRSFSEKVVGSDAFAELSFEAQALYLQLCMAADDEGFVSSPKRIQSSIGAASDTMSALEEAGFLITFDSGVCVIVHFCQSNRISEKRKKATEHADELAELYLDEDGVYHKKEKCEEKATAEVPAYKLHANCMQSASNLQAKPLPPSFLPLSSPSLPSPCTPIHYSPYNPPLIAPTPPPSSSSLLFRARAQEIAVCYWGRKLRKYEKSEIYDLSEGHARLRGADAELDAGDVELLEIAFKASAEAGACSVAYIRGIFDHWRANAIYTPDDYWTNEVRRDGAVLPTFLRA